MLFKAVLILVTAVILIPIVRVVWRLSVHDNHHKQHPGSCRRIKKMGTGSEDIQITSSGLAFITSGVFFPGCSPDFASFAKSKGWGRIEMLDMNTKDALSAEAKELKIKHGKDFNRAKFRPHGLSLLEDEVKGEHLIYVINHAEDEADRVEKFKYLPKTKELQHIKSFHSALFKVTNDLAVIAEDKFYISNYMFFPNQILGAIIQIYEIPLCSVVFHNGNNATPVLENLVDPNGVTLSKDGRFLYVSFPNAETLRVYERRNDTDLRQVQEVTIHTSADNLQLSKDGKYLNAGCHPNAGKVTLHLMNPEIKAPSQVLRIPLKEGLIVMDEITQQFYDRGDLITASSIAGVFNDKLIVGSIMDSLVVCQLPT